MSIFNIYTEKELKLMRDAGYLTSCFLTQGDTFWNLSFELKASAENEESTTVLLRSQRQEQRIFKTSEAALKTAQAIGFDYVGVYLKRGCYD